MSLGYGNRGTFPGHVAFILSLCLGVTSALPTSSMTLSPTSALELPAPSAVSISITPQRIEIVPPAEIRTRRPFLAGNRLSGPTVPKVHSAEHRRRPNLTDQDTLEAYEQLAKGRIIPSKLGRLGTDTMKADDSITDTAMPAHGGLPVTRRDDMSEGEGIPVNVHIGEAPPGVNDQELGDQTGYTPSRPVLEHTDEETDEATGQEDAAVHRNNKTRIMENDRRQLVVPWKAIGEEYERLSGPNGTMANNSTAAAADASHNGIHNGTSNNTSKPTVDERGDPVLGDLFSWALGVPPDQRAYGCGLLSIINATPYRWTRGFTHMYRMANWYKVWPKVIQPGEVLTIPTLCQWGQDTAAEVAYHLEGTKKPMSFMFQHRMDFDDPTAHVQYLEELATLGNAKGSRVDLDFHTWPVMTNFILAGTEGGGFVSNGPPAGWMQAMLPEIGGLPLREVAMVRSHHAGLWKDGGRVGLGGPANSQAHVKDLSFQLEKGGVRVLDFRPCVEDWAGGRIRDSHGSWLGKNWHGLLGATLDQMMEQINSFTDAHPGELIILDIPASQSVFRTHGRMGRIRDRDVAVLFDKLKELKHRFPLPDDGSDVTEMPLSRFIGGRRTAVLIRVSHEWTRHGRFPGARAGFVSDDRFPVIQRWSETNDLRTLVKDQAEALARDKPDRSAPVFHSDWIMTQAIFEVIDPTNHLTALSFRAYQVLFTKVWRMCTWKSYPNWLALDYIHSEEPKTIVAAINHCFAAKRCPLRPESKYGHKILPKPGDCGSGDRGGERDEERDEGEVGKKEKKIVSMG